MKKATCVHCDARMDQHKIGLDGGEVLWLCPEEKADTPPALD